MRHPDITGRHAVHVFAFIGADDPALDAENEVGAGKAWYDPTTQTLRFRNAANDAWSFLGDPAEIS